MENYEYIDTLVEETSKEIIVKKGKYTIGSEEASLARGRLRSLVYTSFSQGKQMYTTNKEKINIYDEYPEIIDNIKKLKATKMKR